MLPSSTSIYSRVHQPVFPTLDPGLVSRIIEENQNQPPAVSSAATSSSHNYNKLVTVLYCNVLIVLYYTVLY